MNDWAIHMQGIEKSIGSFQLGPLDLQVERGYIAAIVGPNGSGKSSLFRILLQTLHPDRGVASIFGQPVSPDTDVELKSKLGYVPEISNEYYNGLRANVLAEFTAQWYPTWNWKLYDQLIVQYDIDPRQKLGKMSKGQRRKFDLILALAHQPELLLLDEPSSGLDPIVWRMMVEEIQKFMDNGKRTVLLATHIMEEVRKLADYVIFFNKGRILGVYEKDMLFDQWKMLWVEIDGTASELSDLPGVVDVQQEGLGTKGMIRLITEQASDTEKALRACGAAIMRTQSVELDEILLHLMKTR